MSTTELKPVDTEKPENSVSRTDACFEDETEEEKRIRELHEKYPRPAEFDNDEKDRNLEERAGFIGTWLFTFISGLINLGYHRPLLITDLWKIAKQDDVNVVAPRLEQEWHKKIEEARLQNEKNRALHQEKLDKGENPPPPKEVQPSFLGAVTNFSGATIFVLLFFQLIVRVESVAAPFVLREFLTWLVTMPNNPAFTPEEEHMGYIYVLIMFLMSTVSNLCNNRFFHLGYHNYAQIRSAINGMLYAKSLRTGSIAEEATNDKSKGSKGTDKSESKDENNSNNDGKPGKPPASGLGTSSSSSASTGQITNMMSVDSDKVALVYYFGLGVVYVPVQIAVLVYFIYDIIGNAIFAGLGVIFVVLPLAALNAAILGTYIRKKMIYADSRVKFTNELLTGIRAVKYYAWERFFADELESVRRKEVDVILMINLATSIMSFVFSLIQPLITVVTFLVYDALGNDIKGNAINVFQAVAYINALQMPLMQLPNALSTLIFGTISAFRISQYMLLPELDSMKHLTVQYLINTEHTVQPIEPLEGDYAIKLTDASFCWDSPKLAMPAQKGKGTNKSQQQLQAEAAAEAAAKAKHDKPVKVLEKINLSIPRGKITAIVGPVGCGKSSLVCAMIEELKLLEGRVEKDKNMPIAYVAQNAWIQTKTIKDNITFSTSLDTPELQERYNKTLDACALRPDLAILEMGDETEVGDRGVSLSGGQRQRVAIARAVFADSPAYCFDDPLSALDAHVAEHIFTQCIEGVLRGKTIVLVTNQLHFLSRCDYVCVLKTVDTVGEDAADNVDIIDMNNAQDRERLETIDLSSPTANTAVVESPAALQDIELDDMDGKKIIPMDAEEEAANKRQVGVIAEFGTYEELMENGSYLAPMIQNYFEYLENGTKEDEEAGVEGALDVKSDGTTTTTTTTTTAQEEPSEDKHDDDDDDGIDMELQHEHPEVSVIRAVSRVHSKKITNPPMGQRRIIGGVVRKGKQISEEELSTGAVPWTVYNYHFGTMGYGFVFLLFFSALLGHAAMVGQSLMLSYWSDDRFNEDNEFYLHGYVSLLGCMVFFFLLRAIFYAKASVNSSLFYHEKLIGNVLHAATKFFDTTPTGRILNRFSKDIDNIDTTIPGMLLHTMTISFSLLGNIVTVCIEQPIFIVAAVGLIIIFSFIQRYYSPAAIQLQRLESNTRSPYIQSFNETLKGIMTIRAFHKAEDFQKQQYKLFNTNSTALFSVRMVYRWGALRVGALQTLIVLIAGMIVASERGEMDIGSAGVVMSMAMGVGNIIGFLVMLIIELQSNFNSVERLQHYTYTIPLERDLDVGVDGYEPPEDWPQNGTVTYHDVEMRYREELPKVLHGVSFSIEGGKKIGVCGRTGSGKSTIAASLLSALYEVESGQILIDGVDISKVALHRLRNSIGIVPQDPVLFSGSIRANLDPFKQYSDEALIQALQSVNLYSLIETLPGGLNYKVTEYGNNFSSGQRQLFCMARVLLKRPRVLILDEATSSVDSVTDAAIQKTIDEGFKNTTKLIIAHRLNTVMSADYILLLDAGKLSEFGSPEELINSDDTPREIEKPGQLTPTITNGSFAKMYQTYLQNSQK